MRFYQSPWTMEDGYTESTLALGPKLPPVIKLRAVLNGAGRFTAVARDAQSGRMIASNDQPHAFIEDARKAAEDLLGGIHPLEKQLPL